MTNHKIPFIMHLKGGEKMNPKKLYMLFCIGLLLTALTIRIALSESNVISIFLLLFFINALISLYVLYSLYEMYFLHEKQGSKLTMSKDKLNIHWD